MKTYCIYDQAGKLKDGWEEINCDSISVDGDIFSFMNEAGLPIIFYRLGQGEAIVFSYSDEG